MAGHGRKNVDEMILKILSIGGSNEAAAQHAGVSARTVSRRRQDPAFQLRLREISRDHVERTAAVLTASGPEAGKTLLELTRSPNKEGIRLQAAKAIIDLGHKSRELVDLHDRVNALEAKQGGQATCS